MFFILFAALVSAIFVSAADHLVTVGDGGTLAFNPTNVTALEGDTVTFSFRSKNHSATQSTFAAPCNKSGIDSALSPSPPTAPSSANGRLPSTIRLRCGSSVHRRDIARRGWSLRLIPTPEKSFQAFLATAQGNGTASSSTGVASTVAASGVVSGASAGASGTASSSAASSTANVNTASNGAAPSLRIHSITFSVVALVFGILL